MDKTMNENFVELEADELECTDGGVAPVLIFLGKAVLAGAMWAAGYYITDAIIN